jgi:hypothetical protein
MLKKNLLRPFYAHVGITAQVRNEGHEMRHEGWDRFHPMFIYRICKIVIVMVWERKMRAFLTNLFRVGEVSYHRIG